MKAKSYFFCLLSSAQDNIIVIRMLFFHRFRVKLLFVTSLHISLVSSVFFSFHLIEIFKVFGQRFWRTMQGIVNMSHMFVTSHYLFKLDFNILSLSVSSRLPLHSTPFTIYLLLAFS